MIALLSTSLVNILETSQQGGPLEDTCHPPQSINIELTAESRGDIKKAVLYFYRQSQTINRSSPRLNNMPRYMLLQLSSCFTRSTY